MRRVEKKCEAFKIFVEEIDKTCIDWKISYSTGTRYHSISIDIYLHEIKVHLREREREIKQKQNEPRSVNVYNLIDSKGYRE